MGKSFDKWFPEGDLDSVYDVEHVELNHGLSVCLIPDGLRKESLKGQKILLHWDNFIGFQVSDESYREDCWVSGRQDVWTFFCKLNLKVFASISREKLFVSEKCAAFFNFGDKHYR